jgi:hypothetical protein
MMPQDPTPPSLDRLQTLVYQLCTPACGGRAPGTREGEAARALLIQALEDAGVSPFGPVGFVQPVPGCGGANLIGRIPGAGPRSDRYILIGAHYDHLGWHTPGRDAYWGADDNAAAVAIAVEVGRALSQARAGLDRSVLLCLFDGEEPPFFLTRGMGSEHFAQRPPVPLSSIDLMICMDLVGHELGREGHPAALRQALMVFGAEKSEGTAALVDSLQQGAQAQGLSPLRLGVNLLPPLSDYHPFQIRQVPFVFLTCGRWRHYHQITDTPDRLSYPKMAAIARFVESLVRGASARKEPQVRYLPDGQDEDRTLRTLWSCLSLLAPWSAVGKEGLRAAERLLQISKSRPLVPAEHEQLLVLLGRLEAELA